MLLFLDIDGVMVLAKGWKSPELLNDGFPAFSNKASYVLQNLISENTTVMLTTSHKSNFSIEKWKSIFQKRGVNIENLECLPPNSGGLNRKDEIVSWFNVNNICEDFIIIDDDKSLNDLPEFMKDNLVLTSPYIGLTEAHLDNINKILKSSIEFN
ncbi:MAG: hypothetical protein H3C64_05055 [Candidatus Kuenenia stuttgartiensis]|nr:hypothetical protein [Candidatus Kuenenia stuttgartiensis]